MRCLITGEPWAGPGQHSPAGLRRLDRKLTALAPLPYTQQQLVEEAAVRAGKMSIQGVQPKLSAVLRVGEGRMEVVDRGGRFIVKPPHLIYPELPENEALTMSLAETVGIEVPVHGLLLNADHTRSYFVRRFDRQGWGKVPVEDFAQLSGASRETKYDSSTERLIEVIDRFCTFPVLERRKILDRVVFAFLTGNEDMHLKNWSLITREDRVELSPAYDLLNSTIPNPRSREELALPLNGRKSKLGTRLFWGYLAGDRLGLTAAEVQRTRRRFAQASAGWPDRIASSFLSSEMQDRYLALLRERRRRLELE